MQELHNKIIDINKSDITGLVRKQKYDYFGDGKAAAKFEKLSDEAILHLVKNKVKIIYTYSTEVYYEKMLVINNIEYWIL